MKWGSLDANPPGGYSRRLPLNVLNISKKYDQFKIDLIDVWIRQISAILSNVIYNFNLVKNTLMFIIVWEGPTF